MRRTVTQFRWLAAICCFVAMLQAFTAIGVGSLKPVEQTGEAEVEECEDFHVRRQRRILRSTEPKPNIVSLRCDHQQKIATNTLPASHFLNRGRLNGCGCSLKL